MARDPAFDAYVLKIYQVLERLDYYRLLGVDQQAGRTQVKKAFFSITQKFHPDRNRDANPEVKQAIYDIFKRLNEAYRVLTDPDKRALYNQQLQGGQTRFSTDLRMSMVPKSPVDTIKNRDARQFYTKAAESLKGGNLMQAELHGKMALSKEPNSEVILELLKAVKHAKQKK